MVVIARRISMDVYLIQTLPTNQISAFHEIAIESKIKDVREDISSELYVYVIRK